jgi:hypothetical protein
MLHHLLLGLVLFAFNAHFRGFDSIVGRKWP